jgi:hypothetical protein
LCHQSGFEFVYLFWLHGLYVFSKPVTSHFIAPTTILADCHLFNPKYKASFIPVIIGVVVWALNRLE